MKPLPLLKLDKYPKLLRDFVTEVANEDAQKWSTIVQSASRLSWCQFEENKPVIQSPTESAESSPKMLKIKTESSTTPPKSIILPISKFGSSIHADTINAFQLKFNHTKGKRKGALEFRSRIDERNRDRYPWSASR